MKNEFDFLNEFGKIDDKFVAEAGHPWTKKTTSFLQIYGRRAACILLIIAVGLTVAASPEIQAAIGEFTTKIGQIFGLKDDVAPYAEVINTSQTKEGITVTLKEAILDENRLFISVSAESAGNAGDISVGMGDYLKINGKEISCISSGISTNGDLEQKNNDYVLQYSFEDNTELPIDNAAIQLQMRVYKDSMDDIADGIPFVLKFTASRKELEKNTRRQPMNVTIDAGDGTVFHFKEISINSLYSRIKADSENTIEDERIFYVKGQDSKGNPLSYRVGTEEANEICFESQMGTGNGDTITEEDPYRMLLPDMDAEFLELQLFAVRPDWHPESTSDDTETDEYFMDESGYTIDNTTLEPVGEKFVVRLINN